MRIFLIIDETYFYQPNFVADLMRRTNHDFVGAALITKVPVKNNIEEYIIRHWYYLMPAEIIKLGLKKVKFILKDTFSKKDKDGVFYSVAAVLKYFQIEYFKVQYNINQNHYLKKIRAAKPDVIVSSNSLIFGEELLHIPKYCINRHSALLPAYGGLWPVFHAVKNREEKVGVSVHLMETKIDNGIVLSQSEINILRGDSIDSIYQRCFAISADVVIRALENVEKEIHPVKNVYLSSYYSFPSSQDWKAFRKHGTRFI